MHSSTFDLPMKDNMNSYVIPSLRGCIYLHSKGRPGKEAKAYIGGL